MTAPVFAVLEDLLTSREVHLARGDCAEIGVEHRQLDANEEFAIEIGGFERARQALLEMGLRLRAQVADASNAAEDRGGIGGVEELSGGARTLQIGPQQKNRAFPIAFGIPQQDVIGERALVTGQQFARVGQIAQAHQRGGEQVDEQVTENAGRPRAGSIKLAPVPRLGA